LAERCPSQCFHLWRFSDEINLFLNFLLERHYLKFYQACFAENFYGLERKILRKNFNFFLRFCSVRKTEVRSILRETSKRKIEFKIFSMFLACYPFVHMTWEGTVTTFCLLYSIGKSDFHSRWLFCQRVTFNMRKSGRILPSKNLLEVCGKMWAIDLFKVLRRSWQPDFNLELSFYSSWIGGNELNL